MMHKNHANQITLMIGLGEMYFGVDWVFWLKFYSTLEYKFHKNQEGQQNEQVRRDILGQINHNGSNGHKMSYQHIWGI